VLFDINRLMVRDARVDKPITTLLLVMTLRHGADSIVQVSYSLALSFMR
jgi:hypothetical protein